MKQSLTFIGVLLLNLAIGQHCAYDQAYILVLNIVDAETQLPIQGLRVSIIGKSGHPDSIVRLYKGRLENRPDVFWECSFTKSVNAQYSHQPEKVNFPFANQKYVRVSGSIEERMLVQVEDVDGSKNGGIYHNANRFIYPENEYSLCTDFGNWQEGKYDLPENYREVNIHLKKKIEITKRISPSKKWVTGKYKLDPSLHGNAERCGYSTIKLKRSGKFKLIDDQLPINTMELPNTSKTIGWYKLSKDSTLIMRTRKRIVTFHARYNSPRWIRFIYDRQRVKEKVDGYPEGKLYYQENIYLRKPVPPNNRIFNGVENETTTSVIIRPVWDSCVFVKGRLGRDKR